MYSCLLHPLLSPRMSDVLASSPSSSSSYFGSLDFLDSQSAFDCTFPHPILLLVTCATASVSIDLLSLLVTLNRFVDQCKFRLFVHILCCDYVGTNDRDNSASLYATLQALKKRLCPTATPTQVIGSTCRPTNCLPHTTTSLHSYPPKLHYGV